MARKSLTVAMCCRGRSIRAVPTTARGLSTRTFEALALIAEDAFASVDLDEGVCPILIDIEVSHVHRLRSVDGQGRRARSEERRSAHHHPLLRRSICRSVQVSVQPFSKWTV